MKKRYWLILFFIPFTLISLSQNEKIQQNIDNHYPARKCGFNQILSEKDKVIYQNWLQSKIEEYLKSTTDKEKSATVYTIPIIVHIIHNDNESPGIGRNISSERITEQLQILNENFRKTHSTVASIPAIFDTIAADVEIEFCLINKYPTGHPQEGEVLNETGIDRVDVSSLNLSNTLSGYSQSFIIDSIQPKTIWTSNEVMNIWVTNISNGNVGFGFPPHVADSVTDGIVIDYRYFGITSGSLGLGRTAVHEVGHYLGLSHIWGDATCGDDMIDDTPTQRTFTSGCPSHPRASCGNSGDNFQNYMDYTNDVCMLMFTLGQKTVMRAVLSSDNRRVTLNASSVILCDNTNAIKDEKFSLHVITYPNPIKKDLKIIFPSLSKYAITLSNLLGKNIYTENTVLAKEHIVNLEKQPNGIYLLQIKSKNRIFTKKIMLAK